jgi:hypothetical protein
VTADRNVILRELLREYAFDAHEAWEVVEALRRDRVQPDLVYRCDGGLTGQRSGCLLAAVWRTPRGPVVHRPGHRFSSRDSAQQGLSPNAEIPAANFPLAYLPTDGIVRFLVACPRRILHLMPGQIRADLEAADGQPRKPIILPGGQPVVAAIYR